MAGDSRREGRERGMGFEGDIWRLLRGPEPVGDIVIDDHDFPWQPPRLSPDELHALSEV
ncbi:hypothetical protein ACWD6R_19205 [Streptomyces sp. NPDC005151]